MPDARAFKLAEQATHHTSGPEERNTHTHTLFAKLDYTSQWSSAESHVVSNKRGPSSSSGVHHPKEKSVIVISFNICNQFSSIYNSLHILS